MMGTTIPPMTLHDHLVQLAERYDLALPARWRLTDAPPAESADVHVGPGDAQLDATLPEDRLVPLAPWRWARRFQEMRRLLTDGTIEQPVMYRSRCFAPAAMATLARLIYRELDVLGYLSGQGIVAVYATTSADRAGNVLVELGDGAAAGIELAAALPDGASVIDRHEVIARRGVVCDQLVDATTRPSSVTVVNAASPAGYTDTDFELFGLDEMQAALVRAAVALLREPGEIESLRRRHRELVRLTRLVLQSAAERRRLEVAPS